MSGYQRVPARVLALAVLLSAATGIGSAQGKPSQTAPTVFGRPPLPTACAAPYSNSDALNRGPSSIDPLPYGDNAEVNLADRLFDTDGDGTRDVYVPGFSGDTAVINRGDGALTFPANTVIDSLAVDLDGDGRTDPIVISETDQPIAQQTVYIVPGTTPPGTIDLDTQGIKLPALRFAGAENAFDQTGDDVDDLRLTVGGNTQIFSGADLMAPGPGGASAAAPAQSIAGEFIGYAAFDPARPSLITSTNARTGGDGVSLTVQGQPQYRLVIGETMEPLMVSGSEAGATLVAENNRLWIALGTGNRSGSFIWLWELTDLCSGARPAAPASPAKPVAADPPFTG